MPLTHDLKVKILQTNLAAAGFNPGGLDGVYGIQSCAAHLRSVANKAVPAQRLELLAGALLPVLREHDMINVLDSSHFIAQACHETMGFYRFSEIWGPTPAQSRYDGRMGNKKPGDGYRYRGRGWFMITGLDNYEFYGNLLGLDLVGNPDQLATDYSVSAKAAVKYWFLNKCNVAAKANDTLGVSRIINVGKRNSTIIPNGIQDRTELTNRLIKYWGY